MAVAQGVGRNQKAERLEGGRHLPALFDADRRGVVLNGVVVGLAEGFGAIPLQQRGHLAQHGAPGRRRESHPRQRAARRHARIAHHTRRTHRLVAERRRVDDGGDEQPGRNEHPRGRRHEPDE